MASYSIDLIKKIQLTHDVYELIYTSALMPPPLPGQFLLCDTDAKDTKLRRAYSVSDYESGNIHFIVKEIPNGKGGSRALCKQGIGHTMQVWGPSGNFILPKNVPGKIVFIGTGTGFAPLYFQAKYLLDTAPHTSIKFIFGVREEKDLFYGEILSEWTNKYSQFSYQFCLSQPTTNASLYYPGRVTEYLQNNPGIIDTKKTLYCLCGSPSMVREVREILTSKNVAKESILFEQY